MRRTIPVFPVLLFLTVSTFAQGADVAVSINADARVARLQAGYGIAVKWSGGVPPADAVLTVAVPLPIRQIHRWDQKMVCATTAAEIRCTLPSEVAFDGGFYLDLAPERAGAYTVTATITSATPDPNPANNTATATIEVAGLPFLRPHATPRMGDEIAVDPGRPSEFTLSVQNDGELATGVVLSAVLPEGGTFVSAEHVYGPASSCTVTADAVVCVIPTMQFHSIPYTAIQVKYIAPDRDDGRAFPIEVTVDADQENFEPELDRTTTDVPMRRRFVVAHASDGGSGSLRQAIDDANAACRDLPCLIEIRSGEPVRPLSPLPTVSGILKFAGWPARAELDGSLLTEGHAIAGTVCEMRITNMAIRNFPGHAVEAWQAPSCNLLPWSLRDALYVKSSELTDNLRGIVAKGVALRAEDNVIRDNRRAGVFIEDSPAATLTGNDISWNGASGVFVDLAAQPQYGYPARATITDNTIHDNREFGICRTRVGFVHITGNSIFRNLYYGIDVDLDLDSPNRPDDRNTVPNKPKLTSAAYDPARDVTIVRGFLESALNWGSLKAEVYVSDTLSGAGHPDAQTWKAFSWASPAGEMQVEIPGDVRGKWVTATITRSLLFSFEYQGNDTSELSNAVQAH